MTSRTPARTALGAAAVLSEAEAVALLPGRDSVARAWLRERGLVRVTPLGRVVVWGEVVDALRAGDEAPPPLAPLRRAGTKRRG